MFNILLKDSNDENDVQRHPKAYGKQDKVDAYIDGYCSAQTRRDTGVRTIQDESDAILA